MANQVTSIRSKYPPNHGRPVDRIKSERILAIAAKHFLTNGYSATSIEGIADDAGVSKVTIYNHFKDKEQLFAAAVKFECDKISKRISLSDSGEHSLRERLVRIGTDIVRFLSRPEMLRFEQRVAAETETFPQLGTMFLDAGPHRLLDQLSDIFAKLHNEGEISVKEPLQAAEQFISTCKGLGDLNARFGQPESADQKRARIAGAVAAFLAAHPPEC